jgi:hypothetical protein
VRKRIREGPIPDAPIRTKGDQRRWPLSYAMQLSAIARDEGCMVSNSRNLRSSDFGVRAHELDRLWREQNGYKPRPT